MITSTNWRAEALAAADEVIYLATPAEALVRWPGHTGVIAEIHLRTRGWYIFSQLAGRTTRKLFVGLRQHPAATA